MNIKRLFFAIVSVFVLVFATDFLIHAGWLMPDYNATKALWRPESEMNMRFGWMLTGQLVCAAIVVIIWAMGFAHRGTARSALTYGFLIGVLVSTSAIVSYVVTPVPGTLRRSGS